MVFLSLPAEVKSLAHAIYKFQRDIGNKKASCINFTLQELVNFVVSTKLINTPLFNISKRKTRAAASVSSQFYDSSWLTNVNKFLKAVVCFKEIIANSQVMDSFFQQFITNVVTSAVAIAIVSIQAKHKGKMLFLWEMIEIFLL